MLWVDEELKRKYPSMWADAFYINPFKVSVAASKPSTADTQVNQTHVDSVPVTSRSEQQPPVAGAQVSTNPKVSPDTSNASVLSKQSTKNLVSIPYVIFNLSSNTHIYIPRGTIIAHSNGNEPEVDVIEVAETIKEAQETMQYRNHLPSRPWLPVPLKSDMICSPAEVKYHRRVKFKDHNTSADTKSQFEELYSQFSEVFSTNNEDIGCMNLITMDIDTGDSPPSTKKPYTLLLKHYDWVQQEIKSLERAGVITRSVSPWASPVIMVLKKSTPGEPLRRRMCINFCTVNALQPKVVKAYSKAKGTLTLHPLPNIDQLYAQLRGAKVFTTLNLRSGYYYHIELGKDSQTKTAFVTPFGKYEFNMVPFALAQAPAYFQALISKVLKGLHKFAVVYLDDIIIFSKDGEEHSEYLRIIFQRLKKASLKLKRLKCDFMKTQIQYLGHLISSKRIQPLPEKLRSIKNMPAPRSPKEVKQFLGLAGYYCKFIPRFSDLSRPLTRLTRKDVLFEWTKECQSYFQLLKEKLCTYPILWYPDLNKSYVLFTDASKYGWAGVLTQPYEEIDKLDQSTADVHSSRWKTVYHPVSYISGLFRGSQLNWADLTKEAYAIYMSVRKLSFYLTNADVIIRSDHLPLKKFLKQNVMNPKVNNWAVELESYNLKFEYIQGI